MTNVLNELSLFCAYRHTHISGSKVKRPAKVCVCASYATGCRPRPKHTQPSAASVKEEQIVTHIIIGNDGQERSNRVEENQSCDTLQLPTIPILRTDPPHTGTSLRLKMRQDALVGFVGTSRLLVAAVAFINQLRWSPWWWNCRMQ